MTHPVTVLDYGIGNLHNVVRALEHLGAAVTVVDQAAGVDPSAIDRLVLPGVGAFGDGMAELRARGFDDLVKRFVATERPFLGICVGMQMMFEGSTEQGDHDGLALLPGRVLPVPDRGADGQLHRVPHIGWRPLHAEQNWQGSPFADLAEGERMYFVHAYAPQPVQATDWLASTDYDGVKICAAARRGAAVGCQFHPERSGAAGLALLRRFVLG